YNSGRLSKCKDHFRAADIVDALDRESARLHEGGEVGAAVVGDVLIGIAARGDAAIEPFERAPAPAVVVRGAEDQHATRLEDALELAEDALIGGDVFDHFRADHTVEGGILEGQPEDRAVHQRVAVPASVAKLGENDVEPPHPRETDDATRPAADIQYAARAGGPRCEHLVAP